MDILITIVTVGGIFAMLSLALNVQMGFAGLINFGIVAYFTAGAYAYVILTQPPPTEFDEYLFGFDQPVWVGLIGAALAAVVFAAITAWPCLRLRGEYLALTTFAFAEVFGSLVTNTASITNGTLGFLGIHQPLSDQVPPRSYPLVLAAMVAAAVLVTFLVVQRITRSPFGRTLLAIQNDELAALQAGKNVRRFRLQAFLVGALISGVAGALYTWYTTVVSPDQFVADVTFTVFIALTLGGIGSNLGAIAGAAVLIGFEEVVQLLATNPFIAERTGAVQATLEGLLFIVLLRLAPGGAAGLLKRRHRPQAPHGDDGAASKRRLPVTDGNADSVKAGA
ncbi:MAG: branched-chain amino acid ABC transporter permease [Actinomycetota bacterium]|nr:branched-chain amino acid ABC transporter permease [Actinomycetota bacterium]